MANTKIHDIPVPRNHHDYDKYYRQLNEDKCKRRSRDWNENNKEKKQAQWRAWYYRNKQKQNAKAAYERAAKIQRTPSWVDKEALQEIYLNRPEGYHVDHIVPLKAENVSGLHVPWNLQYLTAQKNLSKGNKVE